MLFKPNRFIDYNEIDNIALIQYYQAMEVAGISARANNNAKLRRARQAAHQQRQPPSPLCYVHGLFFLPECTVFSFLYQCYVHGL